MSLLFDGIVKVSLILAVALGAVELLHRRSAAIRHWVLAAAVACAAASPILSLLVPSWNVRLDMMAPERADPETPVVSTSTIVPSDSAAVLPAATAPGVPAERAGAGVLYVLMLLWGAGAAISLLVLAAGLTRLARLGGAARRIDGGPWVERCDAIRKGTGLRRRVVLLLGDNRATLGTWGMSRPKVLLPAAACDWSDARMHVVLRHELAHIQRGDWAIQMMAEVVRAVYWFNPIAWIACARLRHESEHACDDAVLESGVAGADYATHLLDLARALAAARRPWLPAPAMARPSSLKGRVSAMLNANVDRTPLSRSARVLTLVALLVVTISIAGFGAQSFFTFSGSVVDSTNRFIPNATLVVTDADRQAKHEVKSDSAGRFELVGLPPGEYALEVRVPGFSSHRDTVVVLGRDLERTIELRVGELEETITVVGSAAGARAEQEGQRIRRAPESVRASRRAVQAECDPATVGSLGGKILPPLKVTSVDPRYPEQLQSAQIGGVVTMDALIGIDGNVQDVQAVSSPHPDLEQAAIEAVRQWQFTPTLLNCTPVEVRMKVTTNFRVQQ